MDQINGVTIAPCTSSDYIKLYRTTFQQDNKTKTWDFIKVHDSVAAVIYNRSQNTLLFVSQFRPAVYLNSIPWEKDNSVDTERHPPSKAITFELCAGIVDKEKPLKEIMKEEILEECGYDVPLENIEKITSFRSSIGVAGSSQTMFYAEVTDEMRTGLGGGCPLEGEIIKVEQIPVKEAREIIYNEKLVRPVGLLFALMWFFNVKIPNLKI